MKGRAVPFFVFENASIIERIAERKREVSTVGLELGREIKETEIEIHNLR